MGDGHGHEHEHGPGPGRRSARALLSNWNEHEGSAARKLALAARNLLKPSRVVKGCCGHPGEPGC